MDGLVPGATAGCAEHAVGSVSGVVPCRWQMRVPAALGSLTHDSATSTPPPAVTPGRTCTSVTPGTVAIAGVGITMTTTATTDEVTMPMAVRRTLPPSRQV